VFNLARELGITLDNPFQQPALINAQDTDTDTHTQSVHRTVDQSIVRLAKKMDFNLKLGAISGSSRQFNPRQFKTDPTVINFTTEDKEKAFRDELNDYFDELKICIDQLSALNEAELFDYLRPSLGKFEIEQGAACQAVQDLKLQLSKIKNMLDDIESHNRFNRVGSDYPVAANEMTGTGLTPKEILALAYYSTQDETCLLSIKEHSDAQTKESIKVGDEIGFLRGLYDARRGYNEDRGDEDPASPDDNRCLGGLINSIVHSLNGSHTLVEVVKITEQTVREYICELINEYLNYPSIRAILDLSSIGLNLMLWQHNNAMPLELREQINKFKGEILEEIIDDVGSYLGGNRQAQLAKITPLFERALDEVRIGKKLQQELQRFDLSKIPSEGLYAALRSNKLPKYILTTNRGYVNTLDYICSETPGKFNIILELAAAENKLMDLVGNKFDNLSYLEPETITAFLVKFSPQNGKNIATYTDKYGVTALIWVACLGKVKAIKELAEAFPTIDPNIKGEDGKTALIVAAWWVMLSQLRH
jgi:hypothetical protein